MTDIIPPDARLDAPAFHRNIEPIKSVFVGVISGRTGAALEVGCGSGQHAAALAATFPGLIWWPSDPDPRHRESAAAWRQASRLENMHTPVDLDAAAPTWPLGGAGQPPDRLELIYSFNVIHISPWTVATGLMRGAGRYLTPSGLLILYGPFKIDGQHTAESNAAFDQSLRSRDPSWGVRDLDDVEQCACDNGLKLQCRFDMPSNNMTIVFSRSVEGAIT